MQVASLIPGVFCARTPTTIQDFRSWPDPSVSATTQLPVSAAQYKCARSRGHSVAARPSEGPHGPALAALAWAAIPPVGPHLGAPGDVDRQTAIEGCRAAVLQGRQRAGSRTRPVVGISRCAALNEWRRRRSVRGVWDGAAAPPALPPVRAN